MEEDIPSSIVGTQEPEALGFEVSYHASALFPGGSFARGISCGGSRGYRSAGLIAHSLFHQLEIGFRPVGRRLVLRWYLEVRIALAGLFK